MDERGAFDEPLRRRSSEPLDPTMSYEPPPFGPPPTYGPPPPYAPVPQPKTRRTYSLPVLLGSVLSALALGTGAGWALGHGSIGSKADGSALATAQTSATKPAAAAPATIDLSGTMTLNRGAFQWGAGGNTDLNCTGYSGYDDIAVGAPVTITNQAGTVVGTGQLKGGQVTGVTDNKADSCEFEFNIEVPAGPFYGVTVSHRGSLTFSEQDARTGNIKLSLGS